MDARRLLPGLRALCFALPILACSPAMGRPWDHGGGTVRLPVAGGSLEVTLQPDRDRSLQLVPDGSHRWVFAGPTAPLVGSSYTIMLANRTDERLKVVVGVDGLNVYGREVVDGSSASDVGSILAPWSERALPGWQLDDDHAQRFVFSTPEWSEGEGKTEWQIGLISVQVYREWRPRISWRDLDERSSAKEQAGAPSGAPAERGAPSAAAPELQRQHAPIGTTSGDDVDSSVRTVRFEAATAFPEAWALIDYGRAQHASRPRPPHDEELLGLDLAPAAEGSRIVAIERGSAAERAGLEVDDVIVRLDTVFGPSPATARRLLGAKEAGDYAFLRVRRGPHELAVKIRV